MRFTRWFYESSHDTIDGLNFVYMTGPRRAMKNLPRSVGKGSDRLLWQGVQVEVIGIGSCVRSHLRLPVSIACIDYTADRDQSSFRRPAGSDKL